MAEAVVSVKTSLDPERWNSGIVDCRRIAHVQSEAVVAWTRAPVEPPRLLMQSYDQTSALLHWQKPLLMSVMGKVMSEFALHCCVHVYLNLSPTSIPRAITVILF